VGEGYLIGLALLACFGKQPARGGVGPSGRLRRPAAPPAALGDPSGEKIKRKQSLDS